MSDVDDAVGLFDRACRRAFELGVVALERCREDGDDRMAAIVALELDQLVKDRARVVDGEWVHTGPEGLSVNAMIGRGWENEFDERCRALADSVVVASRLAGQGLGLDWDWSEGLPPGWAQAVAELPAWPQPWHPPLPGERPEPASPGRPWKDAVFRVLRGRSAHRS
ncbi:MAG: hypothetical protein ACTHOD_11260 [Motilibacteraceae bacterium]